MAGVPIRDFRLTGQEAIGGATARSGVRGTSGAAVIPCSERRVRQAMTPVPALAPSPRPRSGPCGGSVSIRAAFVAGKPARGSITRDASGLPLQAVTDGVRQSGLCPLHRGPAPTESVVEPWRGQWSRWAGEPQDATARAGHGVAGFDALPRLFRRRSGSRRETICSGPDWGCWRPFQSILRDCLRRERRRTPETVRRL